ncbi:MAG: DUF4367 domain-containing protein [Clostridia bacterium]|nr:DUF4367 domain-containing protein [Clostridia bacterium]
MKRHRKPENEQLNEKLKEAAGELLAEEWAAAEETELNPVLRERVMEAAGKERRKSALRRRMVRIGQTAAMLVLTVGVILFCIPNVRAGFVNALVTWYDECFRVEFNPGTLKDNQDADPIVWKTGLTEVPDGYELAERNDCGIGPWEVYMNSAGEPLIFSGNTDRAETLYDTDFLMSETRVNGIPGYCLQHTEDTMTIVTWAEGRAVYSVASYSPDITMEQLIRIAESAE